MRDKKSLDNSDPVPRINRLIDSRYRRGLQVFFKPGGLATHLKQRPSRKHVNKAVGEAKSLANKIQTFDVLDLDGTLIKPLRTALEDFIDAGDTLGEIASHNPKGGQVVKLLPYYSAFPAVFFYFKFFDRNGALQLAADWCSERRGLVDEWDAKDWWSREIPKNQSEWVGLRRERAVAYRWAIWLFTRWANDHLNSHARSSRCKIKHPSVGGVVRELFPYVDPSVIREHRQLFKPGSKKFKK